MNAQNRLAALYVGLVHSDLSVKAARAQERGVKDVGAVCRAQDNQAFFVVKAVHFDQQLVEGLLALVVSSKVVDAAFSNRVKLVDENDARRLFARGPEQVAHAAGSYADKHFDKVRA